MLKGQSKTIFGAVMAVFLCYVQEAKAAPTAAEASVKAIQDLDVAARVAEEQARGRCADSKAGVDLDAETAALTAAYIHLARMERAKDLDMTAEDLAPVALQAAADFRHAYLCNRAAVAHLESAVRILKTLRAKLPVAAVRIRENVDKDAAEINVLKATHDSQNVRPERPAVTTPGPTEATPDRALSPPAPANSEAKPNQVKASPASPRGHTHLEHLALRLELGFGTANLDRDRLSRHRGAYFRTQLLARFALGKQKQIVLLFGPYYNLLGARDPDFVPGSPLTNVTAGNANMHGFGAHFEFQWQPRRTAPWLSFHPFLNIGLEYVRMVEAVPDSSGFQGGGGLLLCSFHGSICPNFRLMSLPEPDGQSPTVQVGIAFDLLRWLDLGLNRTLHGRSK